ncbi:MAG: hypothetical protein ABI416_12540 [Ginsengibacter sp.]
MTKKRLPNLLLCVVFDLIGSTSYLLPFFGEAGDIIWGPLSGLIFYFMFGKRFGALGGVLSFLEEISPGLDFIPTFTIAWFLRKYDINKEAKSRSDLIFKPQ